MVAGVTDVPVLGCPAAAVSVKLCFSVAVEVWLGQTRTACLLAGMNGEIYEAGIEMALGEPCSRGGNGGQHNVLTQ